MRRFIFLLIILFVSVFIGLKIAQDPGYAFFAYKHWTVEMPLWFMFVSVFLGLLLLYFIMRFFDGVNASWARWKNWLWLRRKHKSYSKTNRGLIELIETQWKSAESNLMSGVDQSDAPLINFLAAAKAAHEQGEYEKRDVYLRQAYDLSPQTHVAVGLVQAQLQLKQNKYEQALATLDQLRAKSPKQKQVLKLLERVYIHLGDWKSLLKLIPSLYKAKVLTVDQMNMLEVRTYSEILRSTNYHSQPVQHIRDVWNSIPKRLQKNPELISCYAEQLLFYPDTLNEVESLITATLKKTWNKELVRLYGKLDFPDPLKQLKIVEGWEKKYGPHAMLLLTHARLSVRCQIWGKARSYFEECLRIEATPEAYREYGNLLFQLNDTQAAMQAYQHGLALVERASF